MDNSVYIERFKVIAHSKCFILPCSVIYRVKHFYFFYFYWKKKSIFKWSSFMFCKETMPYRFRTTW